MNRDQIREIFLRNGFTIKDGQTDLKPYVYEAAVDLISEAESEWISARQEPVCEVSDVDYTGHNPDVTALVKALEEIAAWPDGGSRYGQKNIKAFANSALAVYRNGGEWWQ